MQEKPKDIFIKVFWFLFFPDTVSKTFETSSLNTGKPCPTDQKVLLTATK